ncbi:hypothetical protein L6452_19680 [Arctium lappa]|uniref:Uncharacterized protein n=5 Tax=Arctium lappa TaxID=4217 RepID=A0ACB9BA57_ARCLA|nr:hypothetical protein L6452_19676 [Arctium lappa]KAI3718793.1 hypothetical protein L6452_19677 [Arctium lappa]KAI3718794.1 hypothetical protein L6452_19678 [Arctium lappa]KAI3718795.1 hypothetical protein L6452_19679 [Arctium lappa]KAI3718796.1 hypothetical protein L6452_19680 [Arctium lappa]
MMNDLKLMHWSLAAAVESNIIHPIGKTILEAVWGAKYPNVKRDNGMFIEEPGSGSGALATIGEKMIYLTQNSGHANSDFSEFRLV